MSSKVSLRTRRPTHDLPPIATDDELLEWSRSLIAPKPVRRRDEPLRADRSPAAAEATVDDAAALPRLSDEELFAEIHDRAVAASRRRKSA